jgi:hypothetical protein
MPCTCSKTDAPRVTLVDGTVACTWCPAWRHECEARHILNLPTLHQRQDYLYGTMNQFQRMAGGIRQRRGEAAVERLQATMTALWKQRKAEETAHRLARTEKPANDTGNHNANDERKAA